MSDGNGKRSIDERLDAIAASLELLSVNMHAMQDRQRELDDRERKLRRAILVAMQAYLDDLDKPLSDEQN